MISFTFKKVALLFLAISTVACQRQQSENALVTISMPQQQKASASSSCDPCLKFLAVNVSGEGIPTKIYANKEHDDFSQLGTQISGEFNLEIPSGKQRFFQLVAAYADSEGELEVHYGTTKVDLSNSVQIVEIPLVSQGHFEGGHISGRYMDAPLSGPTGRVNINLNLDGTSFTLFKTNILNGWFDFFASKNFAVSYELENGTPLLSDIKLDETFSSTALANNQHVVRVQRPDSYYRWHNSVWHLENEKDTDIVMGFFFSPSVPALVRATKIVCKTESAITNLSNMSTNGSSADMDYNPTTSGAGHIHAWGGVTTSHASCSIPANDTPKYNPNIIYVSASQFDGMGNDNAKSMQGAFTMVSNTNGPRKYSSASTSTYTFHFLPGLADTFFDSAQLYSAPTEPNHKDDILCEDTQLAALGYSPVANTTAVRAANSMTFTLTPPQTLSGHILICPTKSGKLLRLGGMYVGSSATASTATLTVSDGPSYNFGYVTSGASATKTFTITNTGTGPATFPQAPNIVAPFTISGNTCGSTLSSAAICTIDVTYSPTATGISNATLNIPYHDGIVSQNITRAVQGQQSVASLMIQNSSQLTFPNTSVSTDVTQTISIQNIGGSEATAITSSALPTPFSFAGGDCGMSLSPGAVCNITIKFYPTSTGTFSESLTLQYNDGQNPNSLVGTLTGMGN